MAPESSAISSRRPAHVLVSSDASLTAPDLLTSTATAAAMTCCEEEASSALLSGFAALAAAMPHLASATNSPLQSTSSSPAGRWQRAAAKTRAASSAAEMTAAARLKVLQKTPLPMVIARMKVLLERLHTMEEAGPAAAAAPSPAGAAAAAAAACSYAGAGDRPLHGHNTPPRTPDSAKPPGSRCQARRSVSEPSLAGGVDNSGKLSVQTIVAELEAMFGFVSEFLARVPAETRVALAAVARLENYKKDQLIYDIGQQASNFYIILSGRIDIWSHPPGSGRAKSIVSVLRKGDTFGDQAIINKARHSTAASPGSNASLLVVSQEDFLQVFGPYFQDVATSRTQFLTSSVAPLKTAQHAEVQCLCSAMVSSKPPAGKEFDLQQDQVFFVKEGMFELQLIDLAAQRAADAFFATAMAASSAMASSSERASARLNSSSSSSNSAGTTRSSASSGQAVVAAASAESGAEEDVLLDAAAAAAGCAAAAGPGDGSLPTLAQHGVLASVRVKDGKAVGTLGYERELRRQRHASVPRRAMAVLGPGSWFGGGSTIYGAGQLLLALRVVAKGSSCELMHLPLDGVAQQGDSSIIRRLRDDAAFSLTYHMGRLGLLQPGAAVGHPQASLVSASASSTAEAATAADLAHGAPSAAAAGVAGVQFASAVTSAGTWNGGSTCNSGPTTPKLRAALREAAHPAAAAAGVGLASAATACARVGNTTVLVSCASSSAVAAPGALQNTAGIGSDVDAAAAVGGTLRRHGRQRQKHVHVAGSATYSPATMAALQHVNSLQMQCAADKNTRGAAASAGGAGSNASSSAENAGKPAAGCSHSNNSRPGSARQGGSSSRPASAMNPRASVRCSGILAGSAASHPAADVAGGCNGSVPGTGVAATGGSCTSVSRGCSGAVTAAERYWAQPGHSSSGAAAALSPLLSSLFTDGLQPLVHEIEGLLDRAQAHGRPLSAAARLQQAPAAAAGGPATGGSTIRSWSRTSVAQLGSSRPQSAAAPAAGGGSGGAGLRAWQLAQQQQAGENGASSSVAGSNGEGVTDVSADVLQHKPYSSLLAATVMWQRSSDVSVRLPLRQCLTTAEIEQGGRLM